MRERERERERDLEKTKIERERESMVRLGKWKEEREREGRESQITLFLMENVNTVCVEWLNWLFLTSYGCVWYFLKPQSS